MYQWTNNNYDQIAWGILVLVVEKKKNIFSTQCKELSGNQQQK